MSAKLSRRTVLRGAGVALSLPLMESFSLARESGKKTEIGGPRRLMFVYVPNGMVMDRWMPAGDSEALELSPTLSPLKEHRQDLFLISGLAHQHGEANGDGPGDHARASASYLTGAQPRKTASVDIRVGVSVDQVAAGAIGRETRFPSLELGCDKGSQAGECDSGYACAYQFNLAWKTPTLPMPPEVDPRLVFERLFGSGKSFEDDASRDERRKRRKSVLDYVQDDARRLRRSISGTDAAKLDQYVDSVREVERQLERTRNQRLQLPPGVDPIDAVPEDYARHIQLMFDLAVLAFQTDATRIVTLMIAHDGSNRSYPFVGVPDGHHDLSHHGGNRDKLEKLAKINLFHVEQFAFLLSRLKGVAEGESNLLRQSLVMFGSGLADGDAHAHHDLPTIVAGQGGGTVQTNRHLRSKSRTPMCNLYVSLLNQVGAKVDRFGDSTGPLMGFV